jgi:hypothetical protein
MALAPQATAEPKVVVTPKAGTKFYHGHGHHHFEAGQPIALRASVAERLLADGLVVPWSSTPPASAAAVEPAKSESPAALDHAPVEAAEATPPADDIAPGAPSAELAPGAPAAELAPASPAS